MSQVKLGLPHPKRARACGNLVQERDPEEVLSTPADSLPSAQLLQQKKGPEESDASPPPRGASHIKVLAQKDGYGNSGISGLGGIPRHLPAV